MTLPQSCPRRREENKPSLPSLLVKIETEIASLTYHAIDHQAHDIEVPKLEATSRRGIEDLRRIVICPVNILSEAVDRFGRVSSHYRRWYGVGRKACHDGLRVFLQAP
jgi:hypothetical protein